MRVKKLLAALLASAMVLTSLPMTAFAVDCPHHAAHTKDCGYQEGTAGAECTHEHTAACYPTVQDYTTAGGFWGAITPNPTAPPAEGSNNQLNITGSTAASGFVGTVAAAGADNANATDVNIENSNAAPTVAGTSSATQVAGFAQDITPESSSSNYTPAGNENTKETLTVTGLTAVDRIYNGTTTIEITGGKLVGVPDGAAVSIGSVTAAVADKNVSENKEVIISNITLTDADADKFEINAYPSDLTVNITPATLTAKYINETVTSGAYLSLPVEVTGFVGGETAATAEGYIAPVVKDAPRTVGTHTLTPEGGSAANYIFVYEEGTLTIQKKTSGGGIPSKPEDKEETVKEETPAETPAETPEAATETETPVAQEMITLSIGSPVVTVDGDPVVNDVAPVIRNERTYLPLRFVAEALGAAVLWDSNTNTVTIVPAK